MIALMRELYPICSGNSLAKLANPIPLITYEIATGPEIFDWTVPKECNMRDAYIEDSAGRRVIDFPEQNPSPWSITARGAASRAGNAAVSPSVQQACIDVSI